MYKVFSKKCKRSLPGLIEDNFYFVELVLLLFFTFTKFTLSKSPFKFINVYEKFLLSEFYTIGISRS